MLSRGGARAAWIVFITTVLTGVAVERAACEDRECALASTVRRGAALLQAGRSEALTTQPADEVAQAPGAPSTTGEEQTLPPTPPNASATAPPTEAEASTFAAPVVTGPAAGPTRGDATSTSSSPLGAPWEGKRPEDGLHIVLRVNTSRMPFADTETGADVAFKVSGVWSNPTTLCHRANLGEVVAKLFVLPEVPSQLSLTASGDDAWGYDAIEVEIGGTTWPILSPRESDMNLTNESRYWVDAKGGGRLVNNFTVIVLHERRPTPCTTRFDERISSLGYTTSPPGTKCVFGVDPRDEGAHCIEDAGAYGSLGWCYTSHERDSWGSCSENCPLYGYLKVLGNRLDDIAGKVLAD